MRILELSGNKKGENAASKLGTEGLMWEEAGGIKQIRKREKKQWVCVKARERERGRMTDWFVKKVWMHLFECANPFLNVECFSLQSAVVLLKSHIHLRLSLTQMWYVAEGKKKNVIHTLSWEPITSLRCANGSLLPSCGGKCNVNLNDRRM